MTDQFKSGRGGKRPGAGRPAPESTQGIMTYPTLSEKAIIEARAKATGKSYSRYCIEAALGKE